MFVIVVLSHPGHQHLWFNSLFTTEFCEKQIIFFASSLKDFFCFEMEPER